MGFYLRKSLRVGPFRFNLSKSGIGVSTGIPGFRIGTGPRGNYVHVGRGGFYYRYTIPSRPQEYDNSSSPMPVPDEPLPDPSPLKVFESGNILNMVDSSSASLLDELNKKRKKFSFFPLTAFLGVIGLIYGATVIHQPWILWSIFIVFAIINTVVFLRDKISKTTVLFYELDDHIEPLYQSLHDTFDKLTNCASKWHVQTEEAVHDKKKSAGATSAIRRNRISLDKRTPPSVKTNIAVPFIPAGVQSLYFFPDRLLVFEPKGVGAVSYKDLIVKTEKSRFIEQDYVPRDSVIVDKTWLFVNKSGGPDKRFKNNRELPVAMYEDIHFCSATGLNEKIQLSRLGAAEEFKKAIDALAANYL